MSPARARAAVVALVALGGACGTDSGPDPGPASRPLNVSCFAPARVPQVGSEGLPPSLAATGCFDPADPTRPLPALIPYDVNAPLWSDGATKERWLALPEGSRIRIASDGDLELPPGAVAVKTFALEGRRIETRFLVRLLGGDWAGYTYQWNEAGTDAALLDETSHLVSTGGREWFFPARAECKQCHTEAAGVSLGLETAQLDGDFAYAGGPANQLATWHRLGLFDPPLPVPVEQRRVLPRPTDASAPAASRARAYLHANCAHCHRPEIDSSGSVDLRFATPLPATMGCDEYPRKGSQGFGPEVRILAPGKPDLSMIVLRMRLLGAGRMPEVGSLQVDEAGIALVSGWIASLGGCADR